MPIKYSIDTENKIILTRAWDEVNDEDILNHKQKLLSDPQFEAGMKEFSDCRKVTRFNISTEGINQMILSDQRDSGRLKNHVLAMILDDKLGYGLARMYEMKASQIEANVGVFKTIEEACEWLGIDEKVLMVYQTNNH